MTMIINQERESENRFEAFDGVVLHPSLDIKNGILVLGFRYRTKSLQEEDIFVIVDQETTKMTHEESHEIQGKLYCLEKRNRKLVRVEERWNLADMKQFVTDRQNSNPSRIPAKEVFDDIVLMIKRHVELEQEIDYSLLAAWIIGTYMNPIFHAYPFLHIKAPKRSGKSQCLNMLTQLCFNAVKARPSLPALGDTVDALRGTYLIDQADSLERKGNEELLDVLADSYKQGGGKRRFINFDKKRGREILEHDTYCPKVFASIRELPEDLRDRCLIIPLIRSQKNFPDVDESDPTWGQLRAKLYKLLISEYYLFSVTYLVKKTEYRQKQDILGRSLELWLPFLVVLESVGSQGIIEEAWKKFSTQYGFSEYEPSEIEESVIKQLLSQLQEKSEIILSPKELAEAMSDDLFPSGDSPKQKAAKVGWAIKKFNLASEKKPRTKDSVRYLFKKDKVEGIYQSYWKPVAEPAFPTLAEANALFQEPDDGVRA